MSKTKTHWKKLTNPDYLGAWSIEPGKDLIVTIKSAAQEPVTGSGGKKEDCLVLRLEGQKPMILNKTNAKTITQVVGSPYIEDWQGESIQLYVETVSAFGETVDAIRVRPMKPKTAKDKLDSERFDRMVEAIKSGKYAASKALESFDLTKAQRDTIESL